MTTFETREKNGFRFIDEGPSSGVPIVMLHGMLGGLSNWTSTIASVSAAGGRALAPAIPVYELPLKDTSVTGLADYTAHFLKVAGITRPILVGNSLGGHIALKLALSQSPPVSALVLTGASGIHEVMIGNSKMKRYDPDYVRRKAELTFHDPRHVTDELVEGVLNVVRDRAKAIRLIHVARSAKDDTVGDRLGNINVPSLLIWGRQDRLTPPEVAEDFRDRMPRARLEFIDQCGHAPMMEKPEVFDALLIDFVHEINRSTNGRPPLVESSANR